MKKIFIVTVGDYSDYHIVGVFSTKKIAEEYMHKLCADRVEEYEVDAFTNSLYSKGYTRYEVQLRGDVTLCNEYIETSEFDRLDEKKITVNRRWTVFIELFAKDEKHAIKIASEVRAQVIASGIVEQYFNDNPTKMLYVSYLGYTDDDLNTECIDRDSAG